MGQAIAQGLLYKKIVSENELIITTSQTGNNREAVMKSDIVILTIKPQVMIDVLEQIRDVVQKNQLIISIAAGIKINSIEKTLRKNRNDEFAIVRVMPNLAAQVGESMSVWFANKYVSTDQKFLIKAILSAIGVELELSSEDKIDLVTPISGSGPAYIFLITELLEQAAKKYGFTDQEAKLVAMQTLIGTVETLKESKKSAKELREAVTSKGGITQEVLESFAKDNFEEIFLSGITAGYKRAKELGEK